MVRVRITVGARVLGLKVMALSVRVRVRAR